MEPATDLEGGGHGMFGDFDVSKPWLNIHRGFEGSGLMLWRLNELILQGLSVESVFHKLQSEQGSTG